jgi:DNA-binding FadR family transcriptional regulator
MNFLDALIANDMGMATRLRQQDKDFLATQDVVWQMADRRIRETKAWKIELAPDAEKWTGRRTLADKLARQLLRDIRARGWPEGAFLGTEDRLLDEYGVSRGTFRQAVRLLECYSAVKMQRGAKGGLVVTAPNPDKLAQTIATHLKRAGARFDHVRPLQIELLLAAMDFLCARKSDKAIHELDLCRTQISALRGSGLRAKLALFQRLLTVHAESPVIQISWSILSAMASIEDIPGGVSDKRILAVAQPALSTVLTALAGSDRPLARRAMLDYLTAETAWFGA